ncbi:hypothetical protein [Sabulibacter ruber]|uniref:hypothetical protein n=1 Tax=Sabulibacter ruber TaxID=2811901 RepID=UPI001A9655E0|nr:hypothetical protein [Sabulibacter ruber]
MKSLNYNILLLVLLFMLNSASCKRTNSPEENESTPAQSSMTKDASGRERPNIQAPEPIAPGSAQVVIRIEKFLADPAKGGAAGQEPQRAEAKVETVLGYGAGFDLALGNRQSIKVYFPMKTQNTGGKRLKEQDRLNVNLQAPVLESEWLTVNSYSKIDK